MAPIVTDFRAFLRRATSIPTDQNRVEVRLLAAILTVGFAISLFEPIFYLFTVPMSMIFEVASLAPSVWCVAAAFGICLVAVMPHMYCLLFKPESLGKKWPRKWAAHAAIGAAVSWIYLATQAYPMDVGLLWFAYALRAGGSMVVGIAYGYSVNAQQGRAYRKKFDADQN